MKNYGGTEIMAEAVATERPRARAKPAATDEAKTQKITVTVGELGRNHQTVTGAAGMTVGQALERARVRPGDRPILVRGRRVKKTDKLADHDILVVSTQVRGGATKI